MTILFALFGLVDYSLTVSNDIGYDDNVYEYSARDLGDFINHVRSYRFPFETYDDLATHFDCELLLRTRPIKRRTTTLNLRLAAVTHAINREKDNQAFHAGLRQSFGKFALKFDYLFIPRYLIKYYPDPAWGIYSPCAFAEHLLSINGLFVFFDKLSARIRIGREWDNYVPVFIVYDITAWRIGADLDLQVSGTYEPSFGYEFKDAPARGPVPDLSYRQHSGSVSNRLNLRWPRLAKLDLNYRVDYRVYTTDLPPEQDTPHAGRIDITHGFRIAGQVPVLKFLELTAAYGYEFRRASSPVYTDIGAIKNYDRYQLSGGIIFHY
jgi:hypothetical protein